MTGKGPGDDGRTENSDAATVLLVDDEAGIRSAVREFAGPVDDLRIVGASDGTAALDRLGDDPVDCVVADPASPGVDGRQFVADARSRCADCAVVWLVGVDPAGVDDDVLAAADTVVEKGDDRTDWTFLVEKIRGVVRRPAHGDRDGDEFEQLVESARDGLYRLDANGRVEYVNPSFAEMLGYEQSELAGTHASETMAAGELERGQAMIRQLLQDDERESDIITMELVRADGERITVEVHFALLTGDDGAYDGVVGVVRDVTERKRRERELERERARLDRFASVVSHDLRNPLNVASGSVSLAASECESEHLAQAADALDRMEHLIDELLDLARQGQVVDEPEPVALRDAVDRAWASVPAEVDLERAGLGATVAADPSRLGQVFENLFRNSVEHADGDVTIRVGVLPDGRGFYVEDDGPGIPPDEREQVFEWGYTTASSGTGVGLAIVRSVVQAHGWEIAVIDAESGGARFEITGVEFVESG